MHSGSHKPGSITYGVNDTPPWGTIIPLAMQHVAMLSVELVFPVIIVTMAGGSLDMARESVSLMMIAMGIGTILQAWRKGPVGSGYFCAHETGTAYFPAVIAAIQSGGIGLMSGMVMASGVVQMAVSRVVHRLRFLFPTEIIGLIIVMMAFTYISYSMTSFWGVGAGGHHAVVGDGMSLAVGFVTLLVIVSLYVWGGKKLREYAILAGIAIGYASAWLTGVLTEEQLNHVAAAPLITVPSLYGGWKFDWQLFPSFLVAAFCSSIITIGNMSTCQKVNDKDWRRLNMQSVGKGLFAEGLGTLVGGVLGALPQTTSSGSVGLSVATGATSRYLAIVIGGLLIVLSFFSQIAAFLAIMPKPVIGVILIVEIAFILPAGMQICTSRMLDFRKMFILGLALAFGMAMEIVPDISNAWPSWLQQLLNSSLAMASVTAILLTLLFRLGISSHRTLEITPEEDADRLISFMEENGEIWGARREVATRVMFTLEEVLHIIRSGQLSDGPIKVDVGYEEFGMSADVEYTGQAPDFSKDRPNKDELLQEDEAMIKLSGFLVRQHARKVKIDSQGGRCRIHLVFDH